MAKEFLQGLSQADVNDFVKKAQLFFVAGHLSIKLLVYVDQLEVEIENHLRQN